MTCQIVRCMLVTHGTMSMNGGGTTWGKKEWVTEKCGAPIFGKDSHKRKVCDSCLKGWTSELNYMVETPGNTKLIEQESKYKHP